MEREYNPKHVDLEELKGKCGIYQLRNIITNFVYIGSSKNLNDRIREHFKRLRLDKHENVYLQNAYNKYGLSNFTFEIVEFCEKEKLFKIEQYWIDKFFKKNCYNVNPIASHPPDRTGIKRVFTEQHKRNISTAHKKLYQDPKYRLKMSLNKIGKHLGAENTNSKPVVCLETGIEYAAALEATRNISFGNVSACCRGEVNTAGGYHWMYKDDYKKLTQEEINSVIVLNGKNTKAVVCLETRKIYKQLIDAQKDTNTDRTLIRKCCDGKMVEAKGLHWIYYKDYLKITEEEVQNKLKQHTEAFKRCRCLETGEVFKSMSEAARQLNLNPTQVYYICSGKRKTKFKGYSFEFVN